MISDGMGLARRDPSRKGLGLLTPGSGPWCLGEVVGVRPLGCGWCPEALARPGDLVGRSWWDPGGH